MFLIILRTNRFISDGLLFSGIILLRTYFTYGFYRLKLGWIPRNFTIFIFKPKFSFLRENPRIHLSYHFCDFHSKMTISPWKWKFGNFSEFSRGMIFGRKCGSGTITRFLSHDFYRKGACATCDKVIYFLTRWKEFRNVTRAEKFKTSKLTKFMKLVGRCMDETIRKNLYLFADFSYRYIPNSEISLDSRKNWVIFPLPLYILPSGNRK